MTTKKMIDSATGDMVIETSNVQKITISPDMQAEICRYVRVQEIKEMLRKEPEVMSTLVGYISSGKEIALDYSAEYAVDYIDQIIKGMWELICQAVIKRNEYIEIDGRLEEAENDLEDMRQKYEGPENYDDVY